MKTICRFDWMLPPLVSNELLRKPEHSITSLPEVLRWLRNLLIADRALCGNDKRPFVVPEDEFGPHGHARYPRRRYDAGLHTKDGSSLVVVMPHSALAMSGADQIFAHSKRFAFIRADSLRDRNFSRAVAQFKPG